MALKQGKEGGGVSQTLYFITTSNAFIKVSRRMYGSYVRASLVRIGLDEAVT